MLQRMNGRLAQFTLFGLILFFLSGLVRDLTVWDAGEEVNVTSLLSHNQSSVEPSFQRVEDVENHTESLPARGTWSPTIPIRSNVSTPIPSHNVHVEDELEPNNSLPSKPVSPMSSPSVENSSNTATASSSVQPNPPTQKPVKTVNSILNPPIQKPVKTATPRSQARPYKCSRQPLLHYCRNHHIVSSCTDSRDVILFIVNFHNPFYSLLSFFEQSYFVTFCRLFTYDFDFLFIGPHSGADGVLGNGLEAKGYYSYMSLIRVWQYLDQSLSSYLGFFLMNDDSCLNPLLLNSFNFSASFTEGNGRFNIHSKWYWNRQNNNRGVPYPVAFTRAVRTIAKAQPRYRECLKQENWKNGWSDSFYVAQKDVSQVHYFFNAMFNERVFLESAVPTSMNCIGAKAIVSCNHNGNRSVLNYHLHPVKFSLVENRDMCIHRMGLRSL